jgi:hypothetical protein
MSMTRKLTNAEMADLPVDGWKNPKVDTRHYYVTFWKAYEVDQATYHQAIADGIVGQVVNGRFILTNG